MVPGSDDCGGDRHKWARGDAEQLTNKLMDKVSIFNQLPDDWMSKH